MKGMVETMNLVIAFWMITDYVRMVEAVGSDIRLVLKAELRMVLEQSMTVTTAMEKTGIMIVEVTTATVHRWVFTVVVMATTMGTILS